MRDTPKRQRRILRLVAGGTSFKVRDGVHYLGGRSVAQATLDVMQKDGLLTGGLDCTGVGRRAALAEPVSKSRPRVLTDAHGELLFALSRVGA